MIGKERKQIMSELLGKFTNMVKEDKKRAKALFFSESFKEEFLETSLEYGEVYHQLLLGRNREQILEEFLVTAGEKEPVHLSAIKNKYQITMDHFDEPLILYVKKEGWGYIEGKIVADGDFLSVEEESFTDSDFEDGIMKLHVYLTDFTQNGSKAYVLIKTVNEELSLQIVFHENETPEFQKEQRRNKKMFQGYVDFCTGRIPVTTFIEREKTLLDQMPENISDKMIYDLMKIHLQILNGDSDLEDQLTEIEGEIQKKGISYCYFMYLKALYFKTEESIKEAVELNCKAYGEENQRGFLLWMRMNLDASIAYDETAQLEEMKEIYLEGDRNHLLRFEACCIFGENPDLLHRLGSFELEVLEFAAEERLLNDKLIQRVCFLISREKTFSEEMLWMLICIYKEYSYGDVLQAICALLIQGNCMDPDCHPYFKTAISEGIQLIGLQEAFLRTIPEEEYPILPEETLTYFTYSDSLSKKEQSALYANLVKNRRKYGNYFSNYEEMIRPFLEEELEKGHLNQYLVLLYHAYFEEMLENEKTRENLGNIIFYQKLTCKQEYLKKVMIFQKQKKQADTVFLNGEEYIEIFDPDAMFVFFDQDENRYIGSAVYTTKPLWKKEQIRLYCEKCNDNEHYLMFKSLELGEKKELTEEDFPTVMSVINCGQIKDEYRQNIFEKVLEYYWKNGKKEELKDALMYVNWRELPSENRIRMIEYFIAGGLYEEALKGIQQYGYHFIEPELLKKVCIYALTTLSTRRSDMLVGMCSRAFEYGHYNSEMIGYLQKYFKGSKDQMLELWNCGREIGMYQQDFIEETLRICIRDGVDGSEFPVYSRYLQQEDKKTDLIDGMLVEYVDFVWRKHKELPEEFYQLIGKKIDAGKMDKLYQGLYLDYHKNRELDDSQLRRIEKIKDVQMYTGDIFPVLFDYSAIIELPKYLYAKTFVEYQAEEGLSLIFHYTGSRGQKWKELSMKELMPGYYVASAVIFDDEIVDCFITASGEEKRRRKDIRCKDHIEKSKGSRFYELNEMLKERHKDSVQISMEQYELKKQMIKFIKPMIEE